MAQNNGSYKKVFLDVTQLSEEQIAELEKSLAALISDPSAARSADLPEPTQAHGSSHSSTV